MNTPPPLPLTELMATAPASDAECDIRREIIRIREKFGDQVALPMHQREYSHGIRKSRELDAKENVHIRMAGGKLSWFDIIYEELYEMNTAGQPDGPPHVREELVQIAACALEAIYCLDRQCLAGTYKA